MITEAVAGGLARSVRSWVERLITGSVLAVAVFGVPASLQAQESAEGSESVALEEIVVTARKRTESMFDVPLSITVLSEEFIENLGAQDFTNLVPTVPSLNAYQNGPGRTRLYIRGIANGAGNDNDTQNGETVSIYLDEIPISLGAMNPELALFDLQRVEVLRGPQGTLYGAGSMAGTIRQVSNKPNLSEVEGKVEAGVSTIAHGSGGYTFKGLINAPVVTDKFAIRASAYYTDFGGYIDNVLTGEKDVNDGTTKGLRIAARWMINENFTADFSFFHHDYSDNGRPEDLDETPFLSRNYPSFDGYDDEMQIYNMTLNYDLGWGEIVSSTSYFDRTVINRRSLDLLFELALPPGITPHELIDTTDLSVFAQEVRLASTTDKPLQWTVGMYLDQKDTFYLNTFPVPGADEVLGVPSEAFGAPADHLFYGYDDLTVDTYAFFGEAYYTINKFTITGGLRYFNWKQNIDFYQSGLFNGGANSDPRPQGKTDGVNPKLGLSYDVNDDLMLYGQLSRGFRYGGINGAIPESVCADELDEVEREGGDVRFFDPDKLWNFEIGAKGTAADGSVSYSASYFYIKWEDMQTSRSFDCGFGFRENVGKANSQGVELELHAALSERWVVGFGGAYVDAALSEDVPNLGAEDGDQVPYVPKLSFSASADYVFPVTDTLDGFFWADVQYIGDRHTEFNHDPTTNYRKMDAYTVANLRTGVRWDGFDVSLYVHNVFDDDGVIRALRRPPFDPDAVIHTQPRTIGVMLRKSF
jgi:outer membrane receptor protein involved in Fe transport